ncbi:hypothetical protein TrVE_jg6667 [Triparma verrucosa]|uniref:Uncharacterized protein n=1 Tax=Triparma verrucosa TaxID=1606542 RepID=A0A9W7EKX3_9STRA|nr:hypothetical protein TrVE_jg6667 [Triparma verrucosa]
MSRNRAKNDCENCEHCQEYDQQTPSRSSSSGKVTERSRRSPPAWLGSVPLYMILILIMMLAYGVISTFTRNSIMMAGTSSSYGSKKERARKKNLRRKQQREKEKKEQGRIERNTEFLSEHKLIPKINND